MYIRVFDRLGSASISRSGPVSRHAFKRSAANFAHLASIHPTLVDGNDKERDAEERRLDHFVDACVDVSRQEVLEGRDYERLDQIEWWQVYCGMRKYVVSVVCRLCPRRRKIYIPNWSGARTRETTLAE